MKGVFYWYDLDDMPKLVIKTLKEEYTHRTIVHGNIVPNPPHKNDIVIFDLPEDDDYYADSVRGFIYSDGKFMGKLYRTMDNNTRETDELTGTYTRTSKKLSVAGMCLEKNGARDYFYFELSK